MLTHQEWESVTIRNYMERLAIPSGWLVRTGSGSASCLTFVPDPDHKWTLDWKLEKETSKTTRRILNRPR